MQPYSEQLYYYLLLITIGSAALAFLYHLILYFQHKDSLLGKYCLYLFFLSAFLISRSLLAKEQLSPLRITWTFHFWDELLQLLLYYGYIEFVGAGLGIRKDNHPISFKIWKALGITILIIAALHCVLMLTHISERRISILFRGSRFLLIAASLIALIVYSFKKKSLFQRYILYGSFIFLFTGSLAFASFVFQFEWFGFYALSFTFLGEIADVLLFSAAMGHRTRQAFIDKELTQRALEEQKALNQWKDIERMRAILDTRNEERNRIARELHDEIGSSLSSIHIFSDVSEKYLELDPPKAKDMVQKVKATSLKVMDTMSDLVWAINADTDSTLSLIRRIRQFAMNILDAKNIQLELVADKSVESLILKTEAKKNIFLFLKEAINNSAKYSEADILRIRIHLLDERLCLEISDNGKGFDPQMVNGNGLKNLRTRCEELKGSFQLDSVVGKGTTIVTQLPLTNISSI